MRTLPFLLVAATLLAACNPSTDQDTGNDGDRVTAQQVAAHPSAERLPPIEDACLDVIVEFADALQDTLDSWDGLTFTGLLSDVATYQPQLETLTSERNRLLDTLPASCDATQIAIGHLLIAPTLDTTGGGAALAVAADPTVDALSHIGLFGTEFIDPSDHADGLSDTELRDTVGDPCAYIIREPDPVAPDEDCVTDLAVTSLPDHALEPADSCDAALDQLTAVTINTLDSIETASEQADLTDLFDTSSSHQLTFTYPDGIEPASPEEAIVQLGCDPSALYLELLEELSSYRPESLLATLYLHEIAVSLASFATQPDTPDGNDPFADIDPELLEEFERQLEQAR